MLVCQVMPPLGMSASEEKFQVSVSEVAPVVICVGATLNELATIDTPVVVGTCTVTVTGRLVIEPAW